ncbi:hypothetical protein PPL_10003 [Heterostelium album PN500]|uniref:Uncharacterized protein n=1 Tax=Heterostelium pallidum (strain ATCC 26659 / Pp 5 / PN500) TaxID=670386 RepID=D3BPV9_HETP5|nr:hypothetical protein PPL_10003 [Heterostelium album PN500]EFA76242.1 hypothetical protein PPL_10003 [Heterostelium album PN500]|eukprot:XP_020428375.1 hypothetical protein PPL_10003 [Heterostelium album PN500]
MRNHWTASPVQLSNQLWILQISDLYEERLNNETLNEFQNSQQWYSIKVTTGQRKSQSIHSFTH